MNEYKYNKLTQNESIFTYRSDYVTPIATLNTLDPKWITKRAASLAQTVTLKKILTPERLENMWPSDLHQVLLFFISQIKSGKLTQDKAVVEIDGKNIEELLAGLDKNYPGLKDRICDESGQIRRFVNIFVNGEDIRFKDGPKTSVSDGAEVSIIPAIAGGCR